MFQALVSFILMGLEIFNVLQLQMTESVFRWLVPLMLTTAFVMVLAVLTSPTSPDNAQWGKQMLSYGLAGWIGILVIGQWLIAAGFLRSDYFSAWRSIRLGLLGLIFLVSLAGNWIAKRRREK